MSVQTEITRIETAKAAIGTAIAGKGVAVPSGTKLDGMAALIDGIEAGGEDVSAETAEYTSLLTDLETAIDALPDAGSGGGSVGTCTVELKSTAGMGPEPAKLGTAAYTTYVNDEIKTYYLTSDQVDDSGMTLYNVVCDSLMYCSAVKYGMILAEGATLLYKEGYHAIFSIDVEAGGTVTITYEGA